MYSKESLERLKQQVDLIEVLSPHVHLKRAGAAYKALCPFHEEKTPSFVTQVGDSHYHCFGCGAHGDAIAFLMNYLKLSFSEAIETLAERFNVTLERVEKSEKPQGPSKAQMRDVLSKASRFYHFYLLYTDEGHQALSYLFNRGIDLDFIKRFRVGLAPKQWGHFTQYMKKIGVFDVMLMKVGLAKLRSSNKVGEFFQERIMFPIYDPLGNAIGFSARKYREETFGPKYINTSETPLFKKSGTLFGLNYCRKRIVKERRAIVVEGQIDALRLIQEGIDIAVAGQGTAFGEGHVKELLTLGVNRVYMALDGDDAGRDATLKIGHLFQKEGIEVLVIPMPPGADPDTLLKEKGGPGFIEELKQSSDYLSFLYKILSSEVNISSPAAKNEIVSTIARRIRSWDHPLMVHESLRKLANLANVPEDLVGAPESPSASVYIKKTGNVGMVDVDPNRVLETDLLRFLLLSSTHSAELFSLVMKNIDAEAFKVTSCKHIFSIYAEHSTDEKPMDLLTLATLLEEVEQQLFLSEILQKKVNQAKILEGAAETLQKILERNWMERREEIKLKIHSGSGSEEELTELAKEFDKLKRSPPKICI